MDNLLRSDLNWALKTCLILTPGLMMAVLVLSTPKSFLVRMAKAGITPNWITIVRVPIFWLGFAIYLRLSLFGGFMLMAFAGLLDVMDGEQAKAMERAGMHRSQEEKERGKWGDPLADKLTVLPSAIYFVALGLLNPWIIGVAVAIDLVGTMMRKPIGWGERYTRQTAATAIGKIKTLVMCLGLIACMPYQLAWVKQGNVATWFFVVALPFSIASVISRIRINDAVDQTIDRMTAFMRFREF